MLLYFDIILFVSSCLLGVGLANETHANAVLLIFAAATLTYHTVVLVAVVLVTGATGYVASHIVRALLETGEFRVRGTVRSLENNIKLDRLKAALENCKTSPEYVEADLTNAESWTE